MCLEEGENNVEEDSDYTEEEIEHFWSHTYNNPDDD